MTNAIGEYFFLDIAVLCRIPGCSESFIYGIRQRPASKGLELSV